MLGGKELGEKTINAMLHNFTELSTRVGIKKHVKEKNNNLHN